MRLIDADAAVAEWYRINDIDENDRGARFVGYTEIPRWLYHIPTIDAEPVKHGKWEPGLLREFRDTNIEAQEKADKAGYVRYVVNLKCSACGKITMVDNSIKYNFCPNCGADMRGDTE